MLTLIQAQERVEEKLGKIIFPEQPARLYDPIRYILSNGGKRIRPSLVLLGANLFSDEIEAALDPAVAVEIFHNFTLLHDDLMDDSRIRRGQETVHLKWDPNVAILSGDAMSIIANQFVTNVDADILPDVLQTFNTTAVEVCEGQMMDMDFEERDEVAMDEYIRMIELKTSVLIAASLKIGALSVKAGMEDAQELYEFGRSLGIAFQLQDDLLDSYGDTQTFGKKIGNDILTNKKTYLMISALQLASGADFTELEKWLSKEKFDPGEKIEAVKTIFDRYSIREKTNEKIREYFENSMKELTKIKVDADRKKVLESFAENLMKRKM